MRHTTSIQTVDESLRVLSAELAGVRGIEIRRAEDRAWREWGGGAIEEADEVSTRADITDLITIQQQFGLVQRQRIERY